MRQPDFFGTIVFMESQSVVPKKKRGPKPTGKGTQIQVRLQPDLLALLDLWIASQPDPKPNRPEVLRLSLTEMLKPVEKD